MNRKAPALQHKDGTSIRKERVSPALRSAVTLIVTEAYSITDAAKRVGITRETLSRALKRPAVKTLLADVKRAHLESRTYKAWNRVEELAEGAASEKVKLEANRTILQAGGDLVPERDASEQTGPMFVIVKNEMHVGGPPPVIERLPGVFELADDAFSFRRNTSSDGVD